LKKILTRVSSHELNLSSSSLRIRSVIVNSMQLPQKYKVFEATFHLLVITQMHTYSAYVYLPPLIGLLKSATCIKEVRNLESNPFCTEFFRSMKRTRRGFLQSIIAHTYEHL